MLFRRMIISSRKSDVGRIIFSVLNVKELFSIPITIKQCKFNDTFLTKSNNEQKSFEILRITEDAHLLLIDT